MLSGVMALDCEHMLSLFDSKMKDIYLGLGLAHAWPEDDMDASSSYEGA